MCADKNMASEQDAKELTLIAALTPGELREGPQSDRSLGMAFPDQSGGWAGVLVIPDGSSLPARWRRLAAENLGTSEQQLSVGATVLCPALAAWLGGEVVTPAALAAAAQPDLAERAGRALGGRLRRLGFNMIVGPRTAVRDGSVWGAGSEPGLAAPITAALVRGLQAEGVVAIPYIANDGDLDVDLVELERYLLTILRSVAAEGDSGLLLPSTRITAIDGTAPADRSPAAAYGMARGILGVRGPVAAVLPLAGSLPLAEGAVWGERLSLLHRAGIDAVFVTRAEGILGERADSAAQGAFVDSRSTDPSVADDASINGADGSDGPDVTEYRAILAQVAGEAVSLLRDNGALPLSEDVEPVWISLGGEAGAPAGTEVVSGVADEGWRFSWTAAPEYEEIKKAITLLSDGRPVVVVVGGSLDEPWRRDVAHKLAVVEGRGALIVILTGEPADAAAFPDADVLCAVYGLGGAGLRAAWDALRGRRRWRGRLPVDISRQLAARGRGDLLWFATEDPNPSVRHLETLDTRALLARMNEQDAGVAEAVRRCIPAIEAAVGLMEQTLRQGGKVFYAGAGSAGRSGLFDAAEIPPTFGYDPTRVQGVMAGGTAARDRARENAEDDQDAAAEQFRELGLRRGDLVVAITAHGETPYCLGAVRAAREVGAKAVALVNNKGTTVGKSADVAIEVLTGPEFLVGSTRLKSGTAEKLILNMMSTVTMIRLARVHDNLMIDFRAANIKLRDRAERVVMWLAGISRNEARTHLEAADWEVKTATATALTGWTAETARRRLEEVGGSLPGLLGGEGTA